MHELASPPNTLSATHRQTPHTALLSIASIDNAPEYNSPMTVMSNLLSIKQGEGEPLSDFLKRFNVGYLRMKNISDDFVRAALMNNLNRSPLKDQLYRNPPDSLHKCLTTCLSFIEKQNPDRKGKQVARQDRNDSRHPFKPTIDGFHILNCPLETILREDTHEIQLRAPPRKANHSNRPKDKTKWCDHHRDHGHLTKECRHLKNQIEREIRDGRLQHRVRRPPHVNPLTSARLDSEAHEKNARPDTEMGLSIKDSTKLFIPNQPLSFTDGDKEGDGCPPNHALIISLVIASRNVSRVLVDTGSAENIMFLDAYLSLGLKIEELKPTRQAFRGYNGSISPAMWMMETQITAGDFPPALRTINATFYIIKAESVYHAILGRTGMVKLGAVISPYHQKMKFNTSIGIGVSMREQQPTCSTSTSKKRKASDNATSGSSMNLF